MDKAVKTNANNMMIALFSCMLSNTVLSQMNITRVDATKLHVQLQLAQKYIYVLHTFRICNKFEGIHPNKYAIFNKPVEEELKKPEQQ